MTDNPELQNSEQKGENLTFVVRQSTDRLRERVQRGESVYSVIDDVLRDDARTMSDYWEASLLGHPVSALPADLLEFYEIEESLIHSLDFRAGFQLVQAHWYSEIVRANAPERTMEDAALTSIHANDLLRNILQELADEFGKAELKSRTIKNSLQHDPTAREWLEQKMKDEGARQPYLPLEERGIKAAIRGASKLFTQITQV